MVRLIWILPKINSLLSETRPDFYEITIIDFFLSEKELFSVVRGVGRGGRPLSSPSTHTTNRSTSWHRIKFAIPPDSMANRIEQRAIVKGDCLSIAADLLAVGVFSDMPAKSLIKSLDKKLSGGVEKVKKLGDFKLK